MMVIVAVVALARLRFQRTGLIFTGLENTSDDYSDNQEGNCD